MYDNKYYNSAEEGRKFMPNDIDCTERLKRGNDIKIVIFAITFKIEGIIMARKLDRIMFMQHQNSKG